MQLFSVKNLLNSVFAFSLVLSVTNAGAQNNPPPSELQLAMRSLGASLRPLGLNIAKPEMIEANLAHIKKMKESTTASAAQIPPKADKLLGDAKDQYVAMYVAKLAELTAILTEVETALQAKDLDAAKLAYQKILQSRKEGHAEFQEAQ